ncbi:GlsB/YeaQ/YmgE family stress response membrane protein [Streptomyces sp. PA03-3a]|uniref:GlsB/YeaQ/YmgE family stress response membrane protein n=1 Tax=Actinacidiphila glaucinigra TaxID=235986 RepID=UPI0029A18E01|nr:GlsB/YeaQ/YmgE family stress response membrane protein [Streptomyces sp. PA03-3a]
MNWFWAIIVGIVLGFLAKLLLPGRQDIPWWLTIICGILGAFLGNAVAGWIGVRHTSGVDWIRHVLQILGAILVVAVITPLWASVRGRRRRTAG